MNNVAVLAEKALFETLFVNFTMRLFKSIAILSAVCSGALAGKDTQFLAAIARKQGVSAFSDTAGPATAPSDSHHKARSTSPYLNEKSKQFVVNGTGLPDVHFDVGESYAGLLPITDDKNETRKLFFWFFPSQDPKASDEIAVWLNGGPGCSSMLGLLTENGPFLWQDGTLAPVKNPYSFSRLTNYVWIDQPLGTGYSVGTPTIHNELELAEQFKGFWKNFVDTFNLKRRKVYFSGESYAGMYVPYIANSFLLANDTEYFNLKGIMINDPVIGDDMLQFELTSAPFAEYWSNILGLNEKELKEIRKQYALSGYKNYTDKYFQFPPPKQPWGKTPKSVDAVDNAIFNPIQAKNPCFNVYHISDGCPFPYSELGPINGGDYSPPGAHPYFSRLDVQRAINAPPIGDKWKACGHAFAKGGDNSPGPALDGTLKNIIEKTHNAIVGSGALDALIPTNGTLFVLQNLTWNGGQGFAKFPSKPFFVPQHNNTEQGRLGGYGDLGVWREERGLTFFDIKLAGHEVPGYAASAGYRVIQKLLGRIQDYSSTAPLFD